MQAGGGLFKGGSIGAVYYEKRYSLSQAIDGVLASSNGLLTWPR